LLINLIDTLSPNFVVVLTPGASYTGGERFFASHLDLVREIPPDELPSKEAELEAPPSSFLAALRLFYLGVAAGLIEGDGDPLGNRSMMIHPSSKQVLHSIYDRWAHAITENWSEIIRLGQDDPQDDEYQGFINEMKAAHSDLGQSVEDLPSFDDLLENLLESISDTELLKVNSSKGNSPQPNWKQHYSHILTGGDILNRGFTVEGLTVSYMPRGLGTGQVDTIQQRARWFGYKEDYLGYCRVFLSADAIRVYESYIDHEEEMRKSLREYAATGLELAGWKRVFFLSSNLQPTRHSILDSEYRRGNFQDKWFRTRAPHQNLTAIENNRKLVAELRRQYESQWAVDPGSDKRSDAQRHLLITDVPLKDIYSSFLTQFSCPNSSDSTDLVGLLLQVGVYLESHPAETCGVYLIRQGVARRRSLTEKDEINELFQGWDPVGEPNAAKRNYPGDDAIHLDGRLSVQIHNLDLLKDGKVEKEDVPALAVWVPKAMGGSWIAQVPS